jgi:predicted TIM-barrel fold metal-dependent hydrolase
MQYVGEDNVLWGTDSLIYGGPLPQIEAFRDFEIPEPLRTAHGYPELTPERKAKILGLNAARLFCLVPD